MCFQIFETFQTQPLGPFLENLEAEQKVIRIYAKRTKSTSIGKPLEKH